MPTPIEYTASKLLSGEPEQIRQRAFTRWMTRDLLQAATDFCRNIGLHAIYTESSSDGLFRYLFWRTPQDARIEIRSGRTREQFEALDRANVDESRVLLSLHISEQDIYSAVWISPNHYETAKSFLAVYGIVPASKKQEA